MKHSLATFLALFPLFLTTATMTAQPPQIAYIIPDIGAPGMNTLVEIIAPIAPKGPFAPSSVDPTSGLIPQSAVSVEFVRPEDSNRVVISPVVVNWDGRLISCQFFVKPGAATGPVPIRVRVDNQTSNADTFFIQNPQAFGTKNGGGVIGSGGAWGTRSKRGAMILDSVVLGPGLYTMDVSDTDNLTEGEQGYLPMIILSKGPVRVNAGAVLSASAPGKDAGPGGGGGGGYGSGWGAIPPFPGVPGERNTPLGNGFTGGKSNVPLIPSPANSFGKGTGALSRSLNGAEASILFSSNFPSVVRLYSAGPGHPFDDDGRSGGAAAAAAGSGIAVFGTYYGGGGNASKGTGLPGAQDDFQGQVVGNRQIVPLHGGGGGASGGTNDSVGGGGGGGLAIYSQDFTALPSVQANGADGPDGCNNCGAGSGDAAAGGAGGSILVGGKRGVQIGAVNVDGGRAGQTQPSAPGTSTSGNGGSGRFRHDGRVVSGNLNLTSGASLYTGPTIDTLTVATQPLFVVKGTGLYDPSNPTIIQVYIRGENTPWNTSAPYSTTVNTDSTWQVEVAVTTTDSLLYIFAVQLTDDDERSNTDEWTRVPALVFSQAGANIVRYMPEPDLRAPSVYRFDTLLCPEEQYDTIVYRNGGAGELVVSDIRLASGANDIALIAPLSFPRNLASGTSDTIILRADATNRNPGLRSDQVIITSNDPDPSKNPWLIEIEAYSAFRQYLDPDPENPPTIDFGDVPVNSSLDRQTVIRNINSIVSTDMIADSLWIVPSSSDIVVTSRSTPTNSPIQPGDSLTVELRFSPTSEVTLANTFLCARIAFPCLDTICWPITGRGVISRVEWSKSSLEMLIPVCSTVETAYDTLMLSNTGTTPIDVTSISANPAGIYNVTSPAIPPTQQLNAGESLEVIVSYTPGTSTGTSGKLEIVTTDAVFDSIRLDINGRKEIASLEISARTVDLTGFCPNEAIDTVITLRNTGNVEDTVTLSGISAPFSLQAPASVVRIPPGEDTTITVQFNATTSGNYSGRLLLRSAPCDRIDSIIFNGSLTGATYTIIDQPLDFGNIPTGSSAQRVTTIDNSGSLPIRIRSARIVPPSPILRISPSQNFPIDIPAGSTGPLSLTYGPATEEGIPTGTRLEVIIESPCEDTIRTDVVGRGIKTALVPRPSPLNFGGVLSCVTATDTLWLYNLLTTPITVLGLEIDPPSGDFSAALVNASNPTPLVVPGDSVAVLVTFDPATAPDGVKNETLTIRTNGPDGGDVPVQLVGRRLSEILNIAGQGFGQTFPGSRSNTQQFIINDGTAPIAINGLDIPAPFTLIGTSPPLPTVLVPGDTLFVDLEFSPQSEGNFIDSMEVLGLTICGPIFLPLSATSEPSVIAEAFWKDVGGEPGDVVLLPLELQTDVTGTATTEYVVDATFNSTMLLPKRIVLDQTLSEGWTITGSQFDTGRAFFTASNTDPLAGSGTLVFVEAVVLLGNDLSTEVTSTDQTAFTKGGAQINVTGGTFSLEGYCSVGSNRLVRVTNDFGIKYVAPNPVQNRLTVEFELVEDGQTRLTLYDALGRAAHTLLNRRMSANPHRLETELNLPAGVYFLELETPTQRDQLRVEIQ